jgi:drug/metabolite transporter (DMT)-like permease
LGMLIFNDPVSLTRFLAIALIIGGIVLLNLSGGGPRLANPEHARNPWQRWWRPAQAQRRWPCTD